MAQRSPEEVMEAIAAAVNCFDTEPMAKIVFVSTARPSSSERLPYPFASTT